jgi:predicted house-cleaning noncanonical NTP pyrophosphatase (MazG superfamily)
MNDDLKGLKYTKENIELRRARVLELLVAGRNQSYISRNLGVSNALISLDIQFLKEKSKRQLESHFSEELPFIYFKSLEGLTRVLEKVSEILESGPDNKTKMECLRLQAELHRLMLGAGTDGGVIQKAMNIVKVIAPLPGEEEDISAKSQEDREQKEDDVSTEESSNNTEPNEETEEIEETEEE